MIRHCSVLTFSPDATADQLAAVEAARGSTATQPPQVAAAGAGVARAQSPSSKNSDRNDFFFLGAT